MIGAEVCIRGGNINIIVDKNNMIIRVKSDYNLSAGKITEYQNILNNIRPQDNVSQYVQLIYLRELLGKDVAMRLTSDDTSMELIVG